MGNQIGVEIGASGLRIGCAFGDKPKATKVTKESCSTDREATTVDECTYNIEKATKLREYTVPFDEALAKQRDCGETIGHSVDVTGQVKLTKQMQSDGNEEENQEKIARNLLNDDTLQDEEEALLHSYLYALAEHYEILCEVVSMAASSPWCIRRYYLWHVPKEAIDVAIQLGTPALKGKALVLTGINTSEIKDRITKACNGSVSVQYAKDVACILTGIDYLLNNSPESIFSYERTNRAINEVLPDPTHYYQKPLHETDRSSFYPFLLVNLKSGVSFSKVTAPDKSVRIGGSTIGGATFMGLCRLLMDEISTPEEAMVSAHKGSNLSCDMLVSDIYGGDYGAIGLPGYVIASTFGKLQTSQAFSLSSDVEDDEEETAVTDDEMNCADKIPRLPSGEDVTCSLLTMMSFNVMQQAFLHSKIHSLPRIVLVGFLLNMPAFLASVQHSINFWSKGECKTHFIKISPFLSTVGAILYNRSDVDVSDKKGARLSIDETPSTSTKLYLLDSHRKLEIHEDYEGYVTNSGKAVTLSHSLNLSFISPSKLNNQMIFNKQKFV